MQRWLDDLQLIKAREKRSKSVSKYSVHEVSQDNGEGQALASDQLYDFITHQPVKNTAKERTLQAVARSLVYEYAFDHTQLERDVNVSCEVTDSHSATKHMRKKANLVVYPEGKPKQLASVVRVAIIQPPNTRTGDPRSGIDLLEDVMGALPACDYGLWTNGTDQEFRQKVTGGGRIQPEYVELYDLPGEGESAANLDDPHRQVMRIATGDNLKRAFARVHDYIYGNQGLKKDAAFWQVVNLIFCKIHDEKTSGRPRFYVKGTERNTPDGQATIAKRIRTLFEDVKTHPDYVSVFSEQDTIALNDRVLAYAVGELSRYNLSGSDVDVKGAAYEEITASTLKAQRGQFFTPENVIRLMVQMLDPGGDSLESANASTWPRIIDPACGSGRFLTYALDHIRRKFADEIYPNEHVLLQVHRLEEDPQSRDLVRRFAANCLYGIDFDPDLKRAARMNMILNNDGHGNILSLNSLEYPLMLGHKTVAQLRREYGETPQNQRPDPARARLDADLGTFDYVFTNPPFGAKIPIDDPGILAQFDLGHRWRSVGGMWLRDASVQSRVAPEVLFVERCVQWAKPGTGRVAIVLPDGILGNPDAEYIRYWILRHCQVLASVDLPVEAFLPQVGVQASLLFLRRKTQAEMDAEAMGRVDDYSVFMGIAESVGHDRRGNTLYLRDPDGAETIFTEIRDEVRRLPDSTLRTRTTTSQEKRVDDDLPSIAEAYRKFLEAGQVSA